MPVHGHEEVIGTGSFEEKEPTDMWKKRTERGKARKKLLEELGVEMREAWGECGRDNVFFFALAHNLLMVMARLHPGGMPQAAIMKDHGTPGFKRAKDFAETLHMKIPSFAPESQAEREFLIGIFLESYVVPQIMHHFSWKMTKEDDEHPERSIDVKPLVV